MAIEVAVLCLVCILWCEHGYYYFILYSKCQNWPGTTAERSLAQDNLTRILVLTDIHIMGPRKSNKIDKWRREWQTSQSFKISNKFYRPDAVIFLGDILDEGSFSFDDAFDKASRDFEGIFMPESSSLSQTQKRIIVPGNHDVGDHDRILTFPFLFDRFHRKFKSTQSAELIKIADLNIVSVNSMSLNNDTCPLCYQTTSALKRISHKLRAIPQSKSRPIVLTHFPFYRLDDTACVYPKSMEDTVKRKNVEGADVLHKYSSEFILKIIEPRLILSGHTHLDCSLKHEVNGSEQKAEELTISSYSHKYAEYRPSFLLLSANSTHIFWSRCALVDEFVILSFYLTAFALIMVRFIVKLFDQQRQTV